MKKQVIGWILLAGLISLILVGSSEKPAEYDYVPGEIIVKYKNNVHVENENAILESAVIEGVSKPISAERIIAGLEIYNIKFDSADVEEIIEEYKLIEDVEYAEPNYILHTFDYDLNIVPNDANYSLKWDLGNINAPEAWNLTTGNSSVIIAIIDTGVEWDHPDLTANIWNNTDEDCTNGVDDDSNGYIDDCRGYDFVNITSGCSDADCEDEDNNPMDNQGHGTHVAGIAGAVSNNNIGVAGVCWNCTIMPVRAGYKNSAGQGALAVDDVVQAIYYAVNNSATIISMSFGGSNSSSVEQAITDAYNNGTILIASAGNNGVDTKTFPAAYSEVIGIGAINSTNGSWSSSNHGDWVDLAAPGVSIWSTYLNDGYASLSGTSMSAPMAAGAFGLIKSFFPDKNQTDIRDALNSTGTLVNFSGNLTARINVYSALLSLDVTSPLVNLVSPADNSLNLSVNQTFICNSTDWQLANVTFKLWNSSDDLYYNESINVFGVFNETVFNVSNIAYDTYRWNCLVYDNQSNFALASSNFTLFVKNVSVSLISPLNGTHTNNNITNFNCSFATESVKNLDNVTFSLWNSTELVYNASYNTSGVSNSSLFNFNFSDENTYYWNCKAYNNHSESAIYSDNFTIVYDATYPVVNSLNPVNAKTYSSNSQEIIFGFNVSESNLANCSLIVDSVISLTNNSAVQGVNNFTQSFVPGSYTWNVNCSDKALNVGNSSSRTFSVSAPTVVTTTDSGNGGGGGGSGGALPTIIAQTYIVSSESVSKGYTQELSKNDQIKFIFFDEAAEQHSLVVKEIGKDYVYMTVNSEPIDVLLGVGQSIKLNLTSPDYYNLYIKLDAIKVNKAEITIQTIKEEIPKPKEEATGNAAAEDESMSEEIGSLNSEIQMLRNVVNIIVVIFIIIIVYLLFRGIKHMKDELGKTGSKTSKNKKKREKKMIKHNNS